MRQISIQRKNKFLPILIFVFFLSIYLTTNGGHPDHYDGAVSLVKTESFINKGDFTIGINSQVAYELGFDMEKHIDSSASRKAYDLYAKTDFTNSENIPSRDEFTKEYLAEIDKESYYGPNYVFLPIVAVPLYGLAVVLNVSPIAFVSLFLNSIIISSSCVVIFFIGKNIYKSEKIGFVLSLIFGVTSFLWPYTTSMFSRPLAILFLIIGIYLILKNKNSNLIPLFAGISIGLAVFAHLIFILLLPGLIIFGILNYRKNRKQIVFFMCGLLIVAGIIGYANNERFGSPTNFGSGIGSFAVDSKINNLDFEGVYGYLISPGKSIFIYFPVAILYPISLYYLYQKNKSLTLLFIYLTIVTFLFKALLAEWNSVGGYWGPHRYLLPIIPLITISIGSLMVKFPHSLKLRLSIITLAVIGFFVNLVGNLVWIMYAYSYGWLVEVLWKMKDSGANAFVWDPNFSPIMLSLKVLSTGWTSNLNPDPDKMHYHKVGLYGCNYDMYIFCEYGIIPIIILGIIISLVGYIILNILNIKSPIHFLKNNNRKVN